jgi:hypothetical protein
MHAFRQLQRGGDYPGLTRRVRVVTSGGRWHMTGVCSMPKEGGHTPAEQ